MLNPSLSLSAFGGVGVSTLVGVGAYGEAELAVEINLFGTEPGLRSVDLSGELGLKAYIALLSYHRSFAHHTWNLYTANNVSLLSAASAWDAGLYDASAYTVDDLSYLAAESGWLGDVGSLMLLSFPEA